MQSSAKTVEDYLNDLPEDRIAPMVKIRNALKKNLPKGFKEEMNYGMAGYVVPHTIYPAGYHCDPKAPLPFIGLASQKNFIALYHMGIYADPSLLKWFQDEYKKADVGKLDMGKSCIRFTKFDKIPYTLIGELAKKMTTTDWIILYESNLKRKK